MESPRRQAMTDSATSPVRRLYAALVALDSANGVHENLMSMEDSDYARMTGDAEPRFCEWAYQRVECRTLVKGLLGTVLRPTDATRLALKSGCDRQQLEGLPPGTVLRVALRALGVQEPAVPPPVRDGLDELKRCSRTLDGAIHETQPALLEDSAANSPSPAVELGRRGAERLLKVLCFFLWDNGFDEVVQRVVSKGLWGFKTTEVKHNEWEKWLHRGDLGQFNYLLKSTSDEIRNTGLRVPFLRTGLEIWPQSAFAILDSLAEALQTAVHDTQTTGPFEPEPKRLMQKQFKAVEKVLDRFSSAQPEVWRPRTIQFFRRVDDGHCTHHEGYDEKGELVRFYESSKSYELHVPHLFVAATNPSAVAVDVSCSRLRDEFTRSV
jgi:hypothetical protein